MSYHDMIASRSAATAKRRLSDADYQRIARLRYLLRRFTYFSENAARKQGLTSQQYQALLALRGRGEEHATVGYVARCLLIRHNSAVGLVDRLVRDGLVRRRESPNDRRKAELTITGKAQRALDRLVHVHRGERQRLVVHFLQSDGRSRTRHAARNG